MIKWRPNSLRLTSFPWPMKQAKKNSGKQRYKATQITQLITALQNVTTPRRPNYVTPGSSHSNNTQVSISAMKNLLFFFLTKSISMLLRNFRCSCLSTGLRQCAAGVDNVTLNLNFNSQPGLKTCLLLRSSKGSGCIGHVYVCVPVFWH